MNIVAMYGKDVTAGMHLFLNGLNFTQVYERMETPLSTSPNEVCFYIEPPYPPLSPSTEDFIAGRLNAIRMPRRSYTVYRNELLLCAIVTTNQQN